MLFLLQDFELVFQHCLRFFFFGAASRCAVRPCRNVSRFFRSKFDSVALTSLKSSFRCFPHNLHLFSFWPLVDMDVYAPHSAKKFQLLF